MANEEGNKVEELKSKISAWREELEIWENIESEAGIVERRNLINLISQVEKEISELQPKEETVQEDTKEQTFAQIKAEYEKTVNDIEKESNKRKEQISVLTLRIERLKEEQQIYVGNSNLFNEYENNIKLAEEEIIKLKSADNAITKAEIKRKINEARDVSVKKVTDLRMKKEKEVSKKKSEILEKKQKIKDILKNPDPTGRLSKKKLSDGTIQEVPMDLIIYKKTYKLEAEIGLLEKEIEVDQKEVDEYQKYIDTLLGREEKNTSRILSEEEIKYFHEQGDAQERGENGSKENFRANDEFFGIKNQDDINTKSGNTGTFKPKPGKPEPGKPEPGKPEPGKPEPGKPEPGKPEPGKPEPGKPEPGKPEPGKPEPGKPEPQPIPIREDIEAYSNTYNKALNEYKMMLEMYNQDLETLYELQQQYESEEIQYSDYEKHADYMVERYRFMLDEYAKVFKQYESEKNKTGNTNNTYDSKKYKFEWHPDLTQEQIEYIQSELEIYKPEGDDEYIQALLQLGLDPNKQPKPSNTKEEQQNNNAGISQWHPDLTQEQIEYIQSELEIYKPEGDEYIQALLQLGLDPSKQPRYEEKENNVRNIVLEAPEKPEQPMMILEKEKGDEDSRIPKGKKLSNLPVRSFWEIYNDTNTEHASNLAIKIHNFAHMKILPGKDEDSLTKALSVPLIPIKLVMKLGTIIPNKLMGTDKKLDKMAEKISQLSPAEFEVLVSSADKANEIFGANIKDSFDMDYLDPQFMKQYKVNELYLKAVSGRFNGEKLSEISEHRAEALKCGNEIAKLDKIKRSRELTDEEQQLYNELTEEKQEHIEIGKNLRADIDAFSDGIKKRSSAFKNIRGWFLASFNPDNREENAKMAQISKERREAGEIGDSNQVNSKTNEMAEFANQQTKIKGLRNDKIDRGKFSIESPIEMLDRGEENRGRLLLTDVAIIASAIDLVNQIKNIKDVQASIDSHNMDIQNANQANSQIPVSGEVDISKINGAPETQEALARQTVESAFNRTERGDFSANNWDINSAGYKAADAINHAESAQVANAVKNAIANGKPNEALKLATQFFAKNAGRNEQEMQNLLNTGYSYDYSAINWGAAADAQTILNFFNGKAKFNEVVSGTMVTTLQNINDGVSPLSAILAGANAVYQATKVKNKFKHDLRKSANASQENNKEQQENENSDVEHQEDLEQNNNEYDERE